MAEARGDISNPDEHAVGSKNRSGVEMADLLGESPNLFDDLFKDLEDWEAILSSLSDFGVDQNQDEMDLPAPAIEGKTW